jgi:hypothetical protein
MKITVTYTNEENETFVETFSDAWGANPHADAMNHGIRWELKIVSFEETK